MLAWFVVLVATAPVRADAIEDAITDALALAREFPDVPDATDAAAAYAIQAKVVERVYGARLAGYKAGLTSAAAQQRFGVDQPVLGVLPEDGRLPPNTTQALVPGLKIEVEIGFLVGDDSTPAAMLAAIELPRLDYGDMTRVTLPDIVATNVAAYRFIAGSGVALDQDVRAYPVTLDHDGRTLFSATAADALGDPLVAYRWMLARIHALGYRLEPGMLLMTGSLGRVVDAEPGNYTARYGALGELKFTIH